jgi:hypothetical protein
MSFMAYAILANPHIPSRKGQTSLIDQQDDLMSRYDKGGAMDVRLDVLSKGITQASRSFA